jgi:hypothetical protein
MVPAEPVGQLPARRMQGEIGPLVQGGTEPLRTELLGEVPHAGQPPVLTVAQLAEELGDAAAELDRLVRADEDVDVRGHPLAVRKTATDEHVEPKGTVALLRRPQTDVVDLHSRAVLETSGHGDLPLSRQIGILTVAREVGGDGAGHRERVDDLLGVDAGDRTGAHIAGRVAAGLDGGQAHVPEPLPDPGHIGDADPMELNILACGEIGVPVAEHGAVVGSLGVGLGGHPHLTNLRRGQDAPGDLDAHHEGIAALTLGVHPYPLEALLLAGHGVDGLRALLGVGVDDRLGHFEGMAGQLELLDRVQFSDVAVGADEAECPLATAELHPVGVVEVACHRC